MPKEGKFTLELKKKCQILWVAEHNMVPHMWTLSDHEAEPEERHFQIVKLEKQVLHEELNDATHIGTMFARGGGQVWHIFEQAPPKAPEKKPVPKAEDAEYLKRARATPPGKSQPS
jgi:hypothetical protein